MNVNFFLKQFSIEIKQWHYFLLKSVHVTCKITWTMPFTTIWGFCFDQSNWLFWTFPTKRGGKYLNKNEIKKYLLYGSKLSTILQLGSFCLKLLFYSQAYFTAQNTILCHMAMDKWRNMFIQLRPNQWKWIQRNSLLLYLKGKSCSLSLNRKSNFCAVLTYLFFTREWGK